MSFADVPALELGKYVLRPGIPMQLIGFVLLYLIGLSESEDILGKKYASSLLSRYFDGVDFVNGKKYEFLY